MSDITSKSGVFATSKTSQQHKSNILSITFLTFSLFLLSACGGSGGDSTPAPLPDAETYNLSASITGLTGTLVLGNGSDELTITSNGAFTFNADLVAGTTYSIVIKSSPTDQSCSVTSGASGTINDVTIPTIVVQCTTNVAATGGVGAFYSSAPNWNDYIKNDNTTRFNAFNIAADGTETGGYSAVIHGGEMRSVDIGVTSCTGQAASDALGAFDWVCDDSTGAALIVSTGLKDGMNLSDLIDFSTFTWKTNSVTVTGTGALTTVPSASWWGNDIVEDNDGGSLIDAGTDGIGEIYVVTSNPSTNVVQYTIDASKLALVIQPSVILSGRLTTNVISANTQNFLWIEGVINARGESAGVSWNKVYFSVLRNLSTLNAGSYGVYVVFSSNNSLSNITAANNSTYGVVLETSSYNSLSNITATNNGNGVSLGISSSKNNLSNITAANNLGNGVHLSGGSDHALSNVTTANNGGHGVWINGSSDNSLSNVTTTNNRNYGLYLNEASLVKSSRNSLSNVTAANNGLNGIRLYISSNNYFTGLLNVGNNTDDCYVLVGTDPGLTTDCANNGISDATLTTGVTLASSFVGKVTADDAANGSDSNGSATYPAGGTIFDWTSFDNNYRGWGKEGSAFPSSGQWGEWGTGTGRIWDWSLANGDTVIKNVLNIRLNGDVANTITHTWSDASTTTYLRNASEIMGDAIGNDNGLCENGETCLFTPNIGAYQGHGALISAGAFVDGDTLTGITLMKYATNGY